MLTLISETLSYMRDMVGGMDTNGLAIRNGGAAISVENPYLPPQRDLFYFLTLLLSVETELC